MKKKNIAKSRRIGKAPTSNCDQIEGSSADSKTVTTPLSESALTTTSSLL